MDIISQKQAKGHEDGGTDHKAPELETPIHEQDLPIRSAALKADPLARIKGLDLDAGLYYAANDRQLYEIILKAFMDNNSNCVAKIRAALSAKDFGTAQRTAHSLKGTAGTIGAKELQKAAKAAESAMAGNQIEEAQEALRIVEEQIEPLLRELAPVVEGRA